MVQDELFQDIYDFYEIPYWQTTWFKVLVVLGLITVFALIAYFIVTRKKRVLTAWEIALQHLHKINIDRCVNKHDFKKIYFEVTRILKLYLQERYGLNIIDKTDDELLKYLKKNQFDPILQETLQKLLLGASLVKYADEVALKTQVEEDLKLAITLVEKTIPTE